MSVAKLQPLYTVCVRLVAKPSLTLATTWTVAHKAPLSIGFSRQVDCHFLLQVILPTQESDLNLLFPTLQLDSLLQSHQRSLLYTGAKLNLGNGVLGEAALLLCQVKGAAEP